VEAVESRGKHLLIRFSGDVVLHTHMGMTGSWYVQLRGEPWRKPAGQARLVIEAGEHEAVCFAAPVVEMLAGRELVTHPVLRRLGPDVLLPGAAEPGEVVARARARAGESATIGEALLDQQVVSGIGNIFRCEALFLRGMAPATLVKELGDEELVEVFATASRLMQSSARGPRGFNRSFGPGGQGPWVYRRSGRPCRRCSTLVRRAVLGRHARGVYWCPTCQPPG